MNKTVILYTTGCPECERLKMLLDKAGVGYTENNSTSDMINLGFTRVPMLSVDGVIMNNKEAKEWIISMQEAKINEKQ